MELESMPTTENSLAGICTRLTWFAIRRLAPSRQEESAYVARPAPFPVDKAWSRKLGLLDLTDQSILWLLQG